MMHTIRYAKRLRDRLAKQSTMTKETSCLSDLINAMYNLPNDLHASPSDTADATRRVLHAMQAPYPFELMMNAKEVMEQIAKESRAD